MTSAMPQEQLSFFGGPLSTRQQCSIPGWNMQPVIEQPVQQASRSPAKPRPLPGAERRSSAAPKRPAAPAPPKDPQLERLKQLKRSRDFGDLSEPSPHSRSSSPASAATAVIMPSDTQPSRSHPLHSAMPGTGLPPAKKQKVQIPTPGRTNFAPKLQLSGIPRSTTPSPKPGPGYPARTPPSTGRPFPSLPTSNRLVSPAPKVKRIQGQVKRGRQNDKGSASRQMAMAPAGSSRRALAEKAMKEQMDMLRAAAPNPRPKASSASAAAAALRADSARPAIPRSTSLQQRASKPAASGQQNLSRSREPQKAFHLPRMPLDSGLPVKHSVPHRKPHQQAPARQPQEDWDQYEDDDGFIDDGPAGEANWRSMLQEVTRYDPNKYKHEGDDRSMEASWQQIQAEERRSARMGKDADVEAEREEQRRAAEKKARKAKLKQARKSLVAE